MNHLRLVQSASTYTNIKASKTWFLTGVTGFIGRQFLRKIIDDTADHTILIIRDRPSVPAQERGQRLLNTLFGDTKARQISNRVTIVAGDIVEKKFGLTEDDWEQFANSTDYVVHMAACTRFDASLSDAREHNVNGTTNAMEFAKAAAQTDFDAYVHLSTAYVAGDRTDLVGCDELDVRAKFRNNYEKTKADAEANVRAAMTELPIVIFRPSIVVGDSQTGEAVGLSTVYWGIKNYLHGQRQFYANENASLDLVPVDYVVNAMMHIVNQSDAIGRCFLLVGGIKKAIGLSEFTNMLCQHFSMPVPIFLPPEKLHKMRAMRLMAKLSRRHRVFLEQAFCYLPYFSNNPRFDSAPTESMLVGSGIRVPHLKEYVGTLLNYCIDQGWCTDSRLSATA
ncbi:MAG: SDR family oxidoreductase [Gammaproteobacteria bacterium]|nr:SDR family oxidoreductase [Gammaproteobacteria bacterium]